MQSRLIIIHRKAKFLILQTTYTNKKIADGFSHHRKDILSLSDATLHLPSSQFF